MTSTSKISQMRGRQPPLMLAALLATGLAACGSPAKYVAPDGGSAGIGGPATAGASGHPDAATDTAPGTGGTPASGSGGRATGAGGGGGGAGATGGIVGSGGVSPSGGVGGIVGTGGIVGSGGVSSSGGTGGIVGSGGVSPSGGAGGIVGTGGIVGSGGVSPSGGAGGIVGTGGIVGSGGVSPSGGAGGRVASCQVNDTQCSTNGLQTCGTNGQWGMAVACGSNQACTGPVGSAKCTPCSSCMVGATQCASSTSLQSCAAVATGCNVQSTAACGGVLVCERFAPANCADPNWAQWPVPPSTSPTGYTDNGDGTVTDNTTHLAWEKTGTATTMTQPAAVTYCTTMARTGGHSDWRLPTKIELLSIVDFGRSAPSINPIFTGTALGMYWSSTQYVGSAAQPSAWYVEFNDGDTTSDATSGVYNVRCVR